MNFEDIYRYCCGVCMCGTVEDNYVHLGDSDERLARLRIGYYKGFTYYF